MITDQDNMAKYLNDVNDVIIDSGSAESYIKFLDIAIEDFTKNAVQSSNDRITDRILGSLQVCYMMRDYVRNALAERSRKPSDRLDGETVLGGVSCL